MVASKLIAVVGDAAAAAAAATSAAGRTTHDSYGLKLDRAVVVTAVATAVMGWWCTANERLGGEPLFEHEDGDEDDNDGERLSRPPPPPWSDDDDDMDDVFLWWPLILSDTDLPFCGVGASAPIWLHVCAKSAKGLFLASSYNKK